MEQSADPYFIGSHMSFKSPRFFLVFAVLLAAAVVIDVSRGGPPAATAAESAAYAEIVVLHKIKNTQGAKDKCDLFMRNYPDSSRFETVATLAGEMLVQSAKWQEVGAYFRELGNRFPKSQNMDRYLFYQALAFFQQGSFKESSPLFEQILKTYPNSPFVENALYYKAMSHFLSNKNKETLASCKDYLTKFPDGRFAGDIQHRLSFIDFNDTKEDQSDKIIRDLGNFLNEHPDDPANGSMLCLMADTYKKKMGRAKSDAEAKANENLALEAYKKAIWTESPDDVSQYALDSATTLLQIRKDWNGIAELHWKFHTTRPNRELVADPIHWNKFIRGGKAALAVEVLASILKERIADPANEPVEFFIDELVKTLMPRKISQGS